jgi:hypothetical protein
MIWNLLIFWITIQTFQDINFTNQTCSRNKPKYYILPHLFYTNAKIIMHIKYVFENNFGNTFTFVTQDAFDTCPFHFKLSTIPNQTMKHVSRIMCI